MTETGTATTDEQLEALRTGAGIYPLDDRAFLRITGADATRWLNGMVTNNIKDLAPGQGNYNFLLNNQGRIQGDCTIYREPTPEPPAFLLETSAAQIETIQQHLDKFIIMDDVELTRLDFYTSGLLILGPKAAKVLRKIDDPFLGDTLSHLKPLQLGSYRLTSEQVTTPSPGIVPQFFVTADTMLDMLVESAKEAGATLISAETLEALRILEARPKFGTDIRDKDLPQETAQTHALHFSKGCYLGQEIVERIHSRGQVHRTFTQFTLTGDLPQLPAIIESNGKAVGELTSAAPINGQLLALGYLRREAFNQPLTYPGGTASKT